jgi:hypothetical protein
MEIFNRTSNTKLFKGSPWKRLLNPLALEVFCDYIDHPNTKLFAMTGDLDNLGVYVARNGRPKAENLVDYYNQIIRNYLENWAESNSDKILSIAYVPSGEEVFILGVASHIDAPTKMFLEIRPAIQESIVAQTYLTFSPTAATFGGDILDASLYDINGLVNKFRNNEPDEILFPIYLEIIEDIRTKLAVKLDEMKFSDILNGKYPIQMRQLVLTQMLEYKKTTKLILKGLNDLHEDEKAELLELLGDSYGVLEEIEEKVKLIISSRK